MFYLYEEDRVESIYGFRRTKSEEDAVRYADLRPDMIVFYEEV